MVGYNADGPARDRVMRLMQEKDRLESAIRDQTAILQTNLVGMHEPLVDQEGYPRNDIDVAQVRHARHQIICLQNDHKNIMKLIERGLSEVHANLRGSNGEGPSANAATSSSNGHMNGHTNGQMNGHMNGHSSGDNDSSDVNTRGIVVVGFVCDGSPADVAGLREFDEIVEFGSVNYDNFIDLPQILDVVNHSVEQRVNVKIRRENRIINLTIVPRPWQQLGLLGCQIVRKY